MTVYWIDGVNGDNGNDGLSAETAKATFSSLIPSVALSADTLCVLDGVYQETVTINATARSPNIRGMGDSVWIDAEGIRSYCLSLVWNPGPGGTLIENLKLKNSTSRAIYCQASSLPDEYNDYQWIFRNILVTNDNPASRVGYALYQQTNTGNVLVENCVFERVSVILTNAGIQRNNIYRSYNALGSFYGTMTDCAYPGAGAGNINATTYPPVFRDEANWDYSIDPAGTDMDQYIANGWDGANIGMESSAQRTYSSHNSKSGFDSGLSVFGSWINDADCYDPSFPSTTIGSGNNTIWFNEGGSELSATIASDTYTDEATFLAAVDTAMDNSAGSDTYTTSRVEGHITITKDGGGTFNLLCLTGTNSNHAWYEMGFSILADRNGDTAYAADYAMAVGPGSNFVINISAARGNNKLDFDEGSGEVTATVADTSASSLSTVAANVKTALDAAGVNTYTVTFDGDGKHSRRLKISSSGGTLTLKTNDGTNVLTSAWEMLGWDETANKTGATSYLADYATTSSAWELDADRRPTISLDYEPDGRMAQGRSPIQDIGPEGVLRNISWRGTEETVNGRVFNADDAIATAATRTAEARSNTTLYDQDSADTGLDHDFTKFNKFDEIYWGDQFVQARWTLRAVKR